MSIKGSADPNLALFIINSLARSQVPPKVSIMIEKVQKYRQNNSSQLEFEWMEDSNSSYIKVKNVRQKKIKGKSASNAPEVQQEENKGAALRFKNVPIPVQMRLFE
jgi:hypothetical protein